MKHQQEILSNIPLQKRFVYSKLSYLLKNDEISEVVIMVAFITIEGIYLILNELKDLMDKKVRIVIITGFMNNFNSPRVLDFLLRLENLELRISDMTGFHPKLYLIKSNDGNCACIIGSSNLTNSALRRNLEINIYNEYHSGDAIPKQLDEMYHLVFAQSQLLTPALFEEYKNRYLKLKERDLARLPSTNDVLQTLIPNSMQQKALRALSELRKCGANKALIVSATGSGKTILSAFDVKVVAAQRLLFIVHRESIINAAIHSYRQIFPDKNIGKFTGGVRQLNNDFIFASVQMLQKDDYLYDFAVEQFDYIIIDEVHRAGAPGYQKILSHFQPKFLLGMTATPERSDDFDIYRLFDHNLAYEIRLNEALEMELVCPFHYFGISELQVEGKYLDNYSDFNRIDYSARVKHIITNLNFYGHGGEDKVRGLVFTSRIEEAIELSRLFNLKGYKTTALSASDSDMVREDAIKLLENSYCDSAGKAQDYLDYIFTVDIFNEGIDIPSVNQIVLLRPTKSAIVFTQQIGRGLRKNSAKNYCVILDFIGNYQGNFLIAVALSGNNSYDKEDLRSFVCEANSFIPANASISFDRIIREQIFASINNIQINKKFINSNYQALKTKINRVPELLDFRNYNLIDPKIIFKYHNKSSKILYNNFYELLQANGDNRENLTPRQGIYLDYITQELLFAARPDEMFVLLNLIGDEKNEDLIYERLSECYRVETSAAKKIAIRKILTLETSAALQKKYPVRLLSGDTMLFRLDADFIQALRQEYFKLLVLQTLKLGLSYFEEYKTTDKFKDFVLFNRYSRKEVVRILNVNLSVETAIYGYRIIGQVVPIFITYDKREFNALNNKYGNVFLNQQEIVWYSRPYGNSISGEIERIINYRANNLTLMVFLKKSDSEGSGHYYLGNADIVNYTPDIINEKPVIKFILGLNLPLPDSYFDYFVN